MSYKISPGIPETELSGWLKRAKTKYGFYEEGGVNFKHAEVAPIVMCTVLAKDEILLLKRGYGLADAEGVWSTVNGFIDQDKPVAEIAAKELAEELGLKVNAGDIKVARSYTIKSSQEKRAYIVFACLAALKAKPPIKLDREHTEFTWIKRDELDNFDILDGLAEAIDRALALT